jgi:hypothetical protein
MSASAVHTPLHASHSEPQATHLGCLDLWKRPTRSRGWGAVAMAGPLRRLQLHLTNSVLRLLDQHLTTGGVAAHAMADMAAWPCCRSYATQRTCSLQGKSSDAQPASLTGALSLLPVLHSQ